ncbi:uncharacterized protein EV420DRAFT_1035819 [Desarmillaria tabescens]|uniref:Zn(2)-C6 fungal-type domain-containing protein n=1 Tax=Armillaria tabescens TaxID=1929756 RepID=A0AA39NER9_ARMTA|nr:uncharacterized protein EV420DRAFT_1035819 [Desarmillaria tabescens]KAK0464285.1 hypothetical protein EV420DRAFT_1035819 [Desarmillaria tabescens]
MSDTSSPSSSKNHLPKGSACMNCRRRKIKCDGMKPVCGPCSSSDAFHDCEYVERGGSSMTQALEAQIAILESRIQELEQTGPMNRLGNINQSNQSTRLDFSQFHGSPSSSTSFSFQLHEIILRSFLQRCSEIGFFLDQTRFSDSATLPNVMKPSAALLSTAYLWGIHLSDSSEILAYEEVFLARALQSTAQELSSSHPQRIIHCIQAEVLLAHYFFRKARMLEGRYHTSSAVSLVLSARLHKIRSIEGSGPSVLPPPTDLVEESERIKAFWTVFILDNCWTTADNSPSNFSNTSPDSRIDVPWPLDTQIQFPRDYRTSHTLQKFLANQNEDHGTSALALHAKASVLFEQASRIGPRFRSGMSQQEASRFFASFTSVERVIQNFIETLSSVQATLAPAAPSISLMIHTLAHVSMIQLHAPFISRNPASRGRVLSHSRAAIQILSNIDVFSPPVLDSFIGVLWGIVGEILIREGSMPAPERMRLLGEIMASMSALTTQSPFINAQLDKIRHLYAGTVNQ